MTSRLDALASRSAFIRTKGEEKRESVEKDFVVFCVGMFVVDFGTCGRKEKGRMQG